MKKLLALLMVVANSVFATTAAFATDGGSVLGASDNLADTGTNLLVYMVVAVIVSVVAFSAFFIFNKKNAQ